jgi:hypothetical protein
MGHLGIIKDFSLDISSNYDLKAYMTGLGKLGRGGFGSCADIMKIYSSISNSNIKHLNIDGNTKIINFKEFYRLID